MDELTQITELSRRELEIAEAYAGGASYREIAERLFIAPSTVRTHLRAIYKKLGVASKIDLLRTLEGVDINPQSPRPQDDLAAGQGLEQPPVGASRSDAQEAPPQAAADPSPPGQIVFNEHEARFEKALLPQGLAKQMRLVTLIAVALPAAFRKPHATATEEAQHRPDRSHEAVHRVIERFGGRILQYAPKEIVAGFGIERTHDDDVRRALQAALHIRSELATGGASWSSSGEPELTCAIGVATERTGIHGGLEEAKSELLNSSNAQFLLARALSAQAHPSKILISPTTHDLLEAEVECIERDEAYELQDLLALRTGVPRRTSAVTSQFLGRDEELAILNERLRKVRGGSGQAVGIFGVAGIGKSRLLRHFVEGFDKDATTFLLGHCLPHQQFTPYGPLAEICRTICGISRDATNEDAIAQMRSALADAATETDDQILLLDILGVPQEESRFSRLSPSARRSKTFAALHRLITTAAQKAPLVIAVEDVHWIDMASEQWLTTFMPSLDQLRILFIATSRKPVEFLNLEWNQLTQLILPPLDEAQSIALVRSIKGRRRIDRDTARSLAQRAAGNPFFIEELSAEAANPQAGTKALPQTIENVLTARMDRLDVLSKRMLQVASVIGMSIPAGLFKLVIDWDEARFEGTLQTLLAMGYLISDALDPEHTFHFKHILVQEAAYRNLTTEDRVRLHAEVVGSMQSAFPHMLEARPEEAARHHEEAGAYQDAISYWIRASRMAYLQSGNAEAIKFVQRGLALLPKLDRDGPVEVLELKLQLALGPAIVAKFGYGSTAAAEVYDRASRLGNRTGSTREQFRAFAGLWNLHWVRGELDAAQQDAQRLMELAHKEADSKLVLRAQAAMGEVLFHCGELVAADSHLKRGINLAQEISEESVSSRISEVACLSYAAWARAHLGDDRRARDYMSDAVELAEGLSHPFTRALSLSLKAELHQFLNEVEECREVSGQAMHLSREQGFPFWEGTSTVLHGWSLTMCGKWDQGWDTIAHGCAVFEGTGARVQRAAWHSLRSEALLLRGNGEKALAEAEQGIRWCDSTGDSYQAPELHRLRGEALHKLGQVARSADAFQLAKQRARAQGARLWEARIDHSMAVLR